MGCASSKPDPWQLSQQGAAGALSQWLANGGSPDAIDRQQGRGSLLHCAAAADRVDCVKLLLKSGANVDAATPEHGTPLHAAAAAGASNAVPQLLASAANTSARFKGKTAAEVALAANYPAIAKYIGMNHSGTGSDQSLGGRSADAGAAPFGPGSYSLSEGYRQMHKLQAMLVAKQAGEGSVGGGASGAAVLRMPRTSSDTTDVSAAQARAQASPALASSVSLPPGRHVGVAHGGQGPSAAAPQRSPLPGRAAERGAEREKEPPSRQQLVEPPYGQVRVPGAPRSAGRGQMAAALPRCDSLEDRRKELLAWAAQHPQVQPINGGDRGGRPGPASPAVAGPLQPNSAAPGAPGGAAGGDDRLPAAAGAVAGGDWVDPPTPPAPKQLAANNGAGPGSELSSGVGGELNSGPEQGGGGAGRPEGSGHGQRHAADAQAQQAQPAALGGPHGRSLSRIPSGEVLTAEPEVGDRAPSACDSGPNSPNSSANNSLLDDPLLKFLKHALNRQASLLSQSSAAADLAQAVAVGQPKPMQSSPLASAVAPGANGQAPAAAPAGAVAATPPAALPSAPSRAASGSGDLSPFPSRPMSSGLSSTHSINIVDIRPWLIEFEDLQMQKKTIGEGSFGKVYVAKLHETIVACKVLLDLEEAMQQDPDVVWTLSNPVLCNLHKECALMASLRHPNVVQFMGVCSTPPAMVTEYCARGSLSDVLKICNSSKHKANQMTWLRRLNMALDATKGMLYLHKRGVIHRDLKSPNLLVESTWRVKVSDFNLSKIVEDTSSGRSTLAMMNPRWLAPEVLNGEPATVASDVYSWGVVMWELLTFQCPWPHISPWVLVGKIMDGHRLSIPPREELPGPDTARFAGLDAYLALMVRCWSQQPAERPTFEEVVIELRRLLESQARSPGSAQQ